MVAAVAVVVVLHFHFVAYFSILLYFAYDCTGFYYFSLAARMNHNNVMRRKMKEIEPARDYLYRMNNCVNFGSHFIMSVVQLSFFANVFWFFILFYLRVCVFFCAAVVELFVRSIFHLLYDFLSLGYKMWIGQNLCFIRILFASNNILRNERLSLESVLYYYYYYYNSGCFACTGTIFHKFGGFFSHFIRLFQNVYFYLAK